jgi:hypothetical protein
VEAVVVTIVVVAEATAAAEVVVTIVEAVVVTEVVVVVDVIGIKLYTIIDCFAIPYPTLFVTIISPTQMKNESTQFQFQYLRNIHIHTYINP